VVTTTSEEFLSPEEVGERLGVSVYTVRRWIKTGQLRAFRPGKEYRIQESDLEEFLRAREVRPKAPRRSPSEPSFNDVLAEERRSVAVDGMVGLLERWHAWRQAEVQDAASLHFRDATSAALWIADAREEANGFCAFLSEWGDAHPEAFKSLWDTVELFGATLWLDMPALAGEDRLREMTSAPDELAARRMERATADVQASMAELEKLNKAANG
jgi:excisionase family DNA binding protein